MSDQNFLDGLFDEIKESPEGRATKSTFSPWHHPRKHLVRLEQWVYFINFLLEKKIKKTEKLKYFSLPGDDLLDVRTIHEEVCIKRQIKLHFMGFNDHESDSSREQNANISLTEVRALSNIDPESEYHNNNILNIVTKNSLAYQRFKSFGGFDVINLDFCDSITHKKPAERNPNHYNLLTKIIQLQNHRDNPWILFLTTRIGIEHIHDDALTSFKTQYEKNLLDENFREKSKEIFNVYDNESLKHAFTQCDNFRKIISTSFCKWLLSFSLNLNPKTTIKLLDAMEYKVLPKSEYPDMLSLALLFTPHPDQITDPSGLALPNAKTEVFHEPTIASNYIDQIGRCTNCDKYLESDPIKREKIINKSITLLNSARFDTREYREKFG